jgi:hypothetical protein
MIAALPQGFPMDKRRSRKKVYHSIDELQADLDPACAVRRQRSSLSSVLKVNPSTPQVACFDTSFHRTMPRLAQLYALPRKYRDGLYYSGKRTREWLKFKAVNEQEANVGDVFAGGPGREHAIATSCRMNGCNAKAGEAQPLGGHRSTRLYWTVYKYGENTRKDVMTGNVASLR